MILRNISKLILGTMRLLNKIQFFDSYEEAEEWLLPSDTEKEISAYNKTETT